MVESLDPVLGRHVPTVQSQLIVKHKILVTIQPNRCQMIYVMLPANHVPGADGLWTLNTLTVFHHMPEFCVAPCIGQVLPAYRKYCLPIASLACLSPALARKLTTVQYAAS